ncbi:hypothetical protein DA2_3173 [Desulfovibrio sp. A2]|nr:hypothetical protein DA2_3173 [Desulfovibrio sp. A2]
MARKKKEKAPVQADLPENTVFITITADILQETDAAILIRCGEVEDWLPLSQIEFTGTKGDTGVVIDLPEWLGDEKGLTDGMGAAPAPTDAEQDDAASEDDAATEEPGASVVANDQNWLRQETITVTQELTQAEKAEYADEMARLDDEIEELETERDRVSKALKKQIDAKEDERRALSKVVREGTETREIFCDLVADYNTCEMVWTDAHPPHEEVRRRKMTAEERQLPLTMNTRPAPADQPADDVADNGEELPEDAPGFDAHDAEVTGDHEPDDGGPDDSDLDPDYPHPVPPMAAHADAEAVQ